MYHRESRPNDWSHWSPPVAASRGSSGVSQRVVTQLLHDHIEVLGKSCGHAAGRQQSLGSSTTCGHGRCHSQSKQDPVKIDSHPFSLILNSPQGVSSLSRGSVKGRRDELAVDSLTGWVVTLPSNCKPRKFSGVWSCWQLVDHQLFTNRQ